MSIDDQLIKSRVKLLRQSPFFGTLLLNAKHTVTDRVPTAATDGEVLMLNEEFMNSLSPDEFRSVLLHEVLHMALEHVNRMKDVFQVDPQIANIAADIVVNGIIQDNSFVLPQEAITDSNLKHLSVREIYSILKREQQKNPDHLKQKYGSKGGDDVNQCLQPSEGGGEPNDRSEEKEGNDHGAAESYREVKTDWKEVLNKAATIARSKKAGMVGAGLARIFNDLLEPTINWRDALYKYITNAKTDFEGFDRRMVYNNLYLDDLGGGKIKVALFLDTSGSVDEKLLSEFFAEIKFAVNALPNTTGEMWYFDTKLYPGGDISEIDKPTIMGGGGTSFNPVMKKLQELHEEDISTELLGIIFTDGYADMRSWEEPECPYIWCVNPGGLDNDQFRGGETIRIES